MSDRIDYEATVFGDLELINTREKTWGAIRMRRCLRSIRSVRGKVLELGSGAGRVIRTIKQERSDLDCFGCDISLSATKKAHQYGDGTKYLVCDGENLPFTTESFDCLVALDIFEHVADTSKVLREICRVLKNGGTLYIHVPCEGNLCTLYWILLLFRIDLTRRVLGHIHHFKTKEFLDLLTAHGFILKRHWYSMHLIHQLSDIRNWLYTLHLNRKRERIQSKSAGPEVSGRYAKTISTKAQRASLLTLPLRIVRRFVWFSLGLLSALVVHETILLESVQLTSIGNCLYCMKGKQRRVWAPAVVLDTPLTS